MQPTPTARLLKELRVWFFQFLLTHGQDPKSRSDIVDSTCLKRLVNRNVHWLQHWCYSTRHDNKLSVHLVELVLHGISEMPLECNKDKHWFKKALGLRPHTIFSDSISSSVIHPFSWALTITFFGNASDLGKVCLFKISKGGSFLPSAVAVSITVRRSVSHPVVFNSTSFTPFFSNV